MEMTTVQKTDNEIGKAILTDCFSDIFYQFGEMDYQFGINLVSEIINSESNIVNSVLEFINSVKCSETFREFDRLFISIRYQFEYFPDTVDRKSDRALYQLSNI